MIKDIDSLHRASLEHQRLLLNIVRQLKQQGNFSLKSVLSNLDPASLNHLVLSMHNLTDLNVELNEALKLAQERHTAMRQQGKRQTHPMGTTRALNSEELEAATKELIALYSRRNGLEHDEKIYWVSPSGSTVISRIESDQQHTLEQSANAYFSEYRIDYNTRQVAVFRELMWPALKDNSQASQHIDIPKPCYDEIVEFHKSLNSQWYQRHFLNHNNNNTRFLAPVIIKDVQLEKISEDEWLLMTDAFDAQLNRDDLDSILKCDTASYDTPEEVLVRLSAPQKLSFRTTQFCYFSLVKQIKLAISTSTLDLSM